MALSAVALLTSTQAMTASGLLVSGTRGSLGSCRQHVRLVALLPAAPPAWRSFLGALLSSSAGGGAGAATTAAAQGGRAELLKHVDAEHREAVARILEQASLLHCFAAAGVGC